MTTLGGRQHFSRSRPALQSVVYTSSLHQGEADRLTNLGASAVILKSLRGTELLDTIRSIRNDTASPE